MKNIKFITLLASMAMLVGCNTTKPSSDEYQLDLKVVCPAGAPALALANFINNDKVEINADASNVLGYLSASSDKDVVIAPTNAIVSKVMSANAPFKIAATVTFGNLYLLSLGNDSDNQLNEGDYVVAFKERELPGRMFKYVYGNDNLDVHFMDEASDALECAKTGVDKTRDNRQVNYVMLAEPAVTTAKAANPSLSVYHDLQVKYQEKAGVSYFTQASIFVRDSLAKEKVEAFLSEIEKNIQELLSNPSSILEKGIRDEQFVSKFVCPKALIVGVITPQENGRNKIGLGFTRAYENKASIDGFLTNLGFLQQGVTSEEIYYR